MPRFSHRLCRSSTDRRDFYTQCRVSPERAARNAVKPCVRLGQLAGAKAHDSFLASLGSRAGPLRPRASLLPRPVLADPNLVVHGCFQALLQGDASGVEFATAAHCGFLESRGLFGKPLAPTGPCSGVIIDDMFAISTEPVSGFRAPALSASERIIRQAREAYAEEGMRTFSPSVARSGCVPVGSPVHKRQALALVSLKVAAGRATIARSYAIHVGRRLGFQALLFRRLCHGLSEGTLQH